MAQSPEAVASEVVHALGVAWTIHGLYPDPEHQPAFQRAVEDVSVVASGEPFSVAVGPGAFIIGGEEYKTDRQAAERLAIRLFIHNVDVLRISEVPSDRDVVRLFAILHREPEIVAQAGGVEAALARDGVSSFTVVERAPLAEASDRLDEIDRDDAVSEVMAGGVDPAAFAESLMAAAGGDEQLAAKVIWEKYHDVLGKVADDDIVGREEVVQAFVEAFFYLPDGAQVAVLERFLTDHQNPADRAFLDQFAGHELANLSESLDTQAMALLMDYASVVTDPEADARSTELLQLLKDGPGVVSSARQKIASHLDDRYGALVRGSDDAGDEIVVDMPDRRLYFYTVLDGFRDLLSIEDRDDRFGRLIRIWTGKVLAAVRRGDLRRAELWIRAVRDNPTYPDERRPAVEAGLRSLCGPELLEHLVTYYSEMEEHEPVTRILGILGLQVAPPMIGLLADTDDAATRRVVTELLSIVAAVDPAPLVEALDDDRWFLVRNLAVALRRSGRPDLASTMRRLLQHHDHRVRVEAIRGVTVLEGEDGIEAIAALLSDHEEPVRSAAISALGGLSSHEATEKLIDALAAPSLTVAQRSRAIELLGREGSDDARNVLTRMAKRKFAITGAARQVRDAARKALEDLDV